MTVRANKGAVCEQFLVYVCSLIDLMSFFMEFFLLFDIEAQITVPAYLCPFCNEQVQRANNLPTLVSVDKCLPDFSMFLITF